MLQVNTQIQLPMSKIRHAITQVQEQEENHNGLTFITLMFLSDFNIILIIILNHSSNLLQGIHTQYAAHVHLDTSYPHPDTVHYIYVNFTVCIFSTFITTHFTIWPHDRLDNAHIRGAHFRLEYKVWRFQWLMCVCVYTTWIWLRNTVKTCYKYC
jgi:hypothetical protein